ncbi:MAG: RidA family protein [Coriobacteriia bacterium]|nr:RidA family protein [Coriobacteriia bacterium]
MSVVQTDKAPAAIGPYSQGIIAGGLLFASGQIALDPETGGMVGQTVQEQAHQVLRNVAALLEAAGTDFDHVVKTTCFLSDMGNFAAFNQVYAEYFPGRKPARSAVEAPHLPKGALVEVEVVAEVVAD